MGLLRKFIGKGEGIRIAAAFVFLFLFACDGSETWEYSGFVEGEFIRPAPVEGGTLAVLHVREGDRVGAGDLLFSLDDTVQRARVAAAEANLAELDARRANLEYGRRPEEIAVLEANLKRAEANLELARLNFERARELLADGVTSPERRDSAKAEFEAADAEVAALEAELNVARLPARGEEIAAARSAISAADAALEEARWQLGERAIAAPVDARVDGRYFLPGDFVAAGQPVLSLLPAGGVKIRFFVPAPEISSITPGQVVEALCDGCPEPVRARVTFIAERAEFTPPVIYSEKTRAKLMFRVEARPENAGDHLHPGLPVDVTVAR